MTEIIWGAAVLLVLGLSTCMFVMNKKKKKQDVQVDFENECVIIRWNSHVVKFKFKREDDYLYYTGSECNEPYSVSLYSNINDTELCWVLWTQCGNDQVSIKTDLESKYEVI